MTARKEARPQIVAECQHARIAVAVILEADAARVDVVPIHLDDQPVLREVGVDLHAADDHVELRNRDVREDADLDEHRLEFGLRRVVAAGE